MGWLNKMIQFKEKSRKAGEQVTNMLAQGIILQTMHMCDEPWALLETGECWTADIPSAHGGRYSSISGPPYLRARISLV